MKITGREVFEIKYLDEHVCCSNYIHDNHASFKNEVYKSGEKFSLFSKRNFMVLFLSKGKLQIISEYNETKFVGISEMCLLDRNTNFRLKTFGKTEFILLCFDYPQIKCDKYSLTGLVNYVKNLPDTVRILSMKEIFTPYLHSVQLYNNAKLSCKFLHNIKETEWLFLMRAYHTKEESAYFLEPIIKSINEFSALVKEHYMKVKSVKELAGICNMTEKTFTRKFKEQFNETPKQWILNQKAKFINSDLKSHSMNIKLISNKYGFSSPSHFNNYYRKKFNKTPGSE